MLIVCTGRIYTGYIITWLAWAITSLNTPIGKEMATEKVLKIDKTRLIKNKSPTPTKEQSYMQKERNISLSFLTKNSGKGPTAKTNKTSKNKRKNKKEGKNSDKVDNPAPTKNQIYNMKDNTKGKSIEELQGYQSCGSGTIQNR